MMTDGAKQALYFGCWDRAGHYLHDIAGRTVRDNPTHWDLFLMDGGLLKNGKVVDDPTGKVYWTCGGRPEFWYAFYWWDRSVDTRGACNSGFYVRGFGHNEPVAAFSYACSQFPQVVTRQKFPLELQNIPAPQVTKIIETLGFDPTNHHNAAKCPYCNPTGALVLATEARDTALDQIADLLNARGEAIMDEEIEFQEGYTSSDMQCAKSNVLFRFSTQLRTMKSSQSVTTGHSDEKRGA